MTPAPAFSRTERVWLMRLRTGPREPVRNHDALRRLVARGLVIPVFIGAGEGYRRFFARARGARFYPSRPRILPCGVSLLAVGGLS